MKLVPPDIRQVSVPVDVPVCAAAGATDVGTAQRKVSAEAAARTLLRVDMRMTQILTLLNDLVECARILKRRKGRIKTLDPVQ